MTIHAQLVLFFLRLQGLGVELRFEGEQGALHRSFLARAVEGLSVSMHVRYRIVVSRK